MLFWLYSTKVFMFFQFSSTSKNVFSLVKDKKEALFFGIFCVIKRIMEVFLYFHIVFFIF
jgi:hypothetical protein